MENIFFSSDLSLSLNPMTFFQSQKPQSSKTQIFNVLCVDETDQELLNPPKFFYDFWALEKLKPTKTQINSLSIENVQQRTNPPAMFFDFFELEKKTQVCNLFAKALESQSRKLDVKQSQQLSNPSVVTTDTTIESDQIKNLSASSTPKIVGKSKEHSGATRDASNMASATSQKSTIERVQSKNFKVYLTSVIAGKSKKRNAATRDVSNEASTSSTISRKRTKMDTINRERALVIYDPNPPEAAHEVVPIRAVNPNPQPHERFNIKKVLTASDVNTLSRFLIRKADINTYILPGLSEEQRQQVESFEGLPVVVRDLDTNSEHQLRFKFSSKSHAYILISNWSEDFVRRRGLQEGNEVGMNWDGQRLRFSFSVLSRGGRVAAVDL
ncbi:hypothetical protein GIB67_002780 [Kingdonia uniflora]|uniref:TF-B3 domain-containing protein n=1 Tax=Kingdonia uniflora TaxID=39325 RepID=A0A7J7LSP7_9MAGN|nr:hypothetical protein GIB67_002780 [Kingdonia uniflora]